MKLIRVPLLVLFIHFAIVQISKIEGVSMQKTLFEGDYVFISQFSYGIPIPKLYKYDLQLFPDFFNNGHLISFDGPEYGDIATIEYQKNEKYEHYVKRCIGKEMDELIFTRNNIYINSKNIKGNNKLKIWNKDFYKNPFPQLFIGEKDFADSIDFLSTDVIAKRNQVLVPIYIEAIKEEPFEINGKKYNAFFYKVPQNRYFMIGDNINMSNDSRSFGAIEYKEILGKVVGKVFSS